MLTPAKRQRASGQDRPPAVPTPVPAHCRCPDCGREVQVTVTNAGPTTRFYPSPDGPANARFVFVQHYRGYDPKDRIECPGSRQPIPSR